MDVPSEPGLFVDHHGQLHRRPPEVHPTRRRGVHAVLRLAGSILAVRPPGAAWLELPGGGIEDGETTDQALSRELAEEAGLRLSPAELRAVREVHFTSRYFSTNNSAYWLYAQTFRLIELDRPPNFGQPLEAGHYHSWLALADIAGVPLHHVHRHGLARLLNGA